MRLMPDFRLCLVSLTAVLCACPPPPPPCVEGDEEGCLDGGTLPEDLCNSKDEASADSRCQLTLGEGKVGYISTLADGGWDRDWYLAQMPATLNGRSLLHVSAGYPASVPQTAVNFQVNVLEEGTTSITTGLDKHGTAAPKPVDLVLPYGKASARLYVLVSDEGTTAAPRVDNRNAYRVMVEVIDNPDVNEPNDTAADATPIMPTVANGLTQFTQSGYLATNDDVDLFTFSVTGAARQIIYLHLTSGAVLTPPPPFRLSYVLLDPNGVPLDEGRMDNEFLQVDLATARVAAAPGTYTVKVLGYRGSTQVGAVKGDLRLKYDLKVMVMPDLDVNEPNDTVAQARPHTASLGESWQVVGRLSSIPDEDWLAVELPGEARTTVLRYRFVAGSAGGRFDKPTSLVPNRQLKVVTQITGAGTLQDLQVSCKNDPVVCPKGYGDDNGRKSLVDALCANNDPPQCLQAERNEEVRFERQKNLLGSIGVPPHGGTVRYLLRLSDLGLGLSKYADDIPYTLEFRWEADPEDTPSPLSLGSQSVTGSLTYGFGRVGDIDLNEGHGVRGPNDYDAVPTDLDTFTFNVPLAADQSWELSWELQHTDGGSRPPAEAYLEFGFCDGSGGTCRGVTRTMVYSGSRLTPWYLPTSYSNATTLFSRTAGATSTTFTALPVGCWCMPQLFASWSSFTVTVGAYDRLTDEPLRYRLTQTLGAYPQSYSGDGGSVSCPGPGADAGCRFGL